MLDFFRVKLKRIRNQVSVAIGLGAALIIIGTMLFKQVLELTWEEAFYFAVVTLTTVGYGDITPETGLQRVVVALYVLIGVTVFVTAIGIIGMNVIEKRQARLAEKANARNELLSTRITELEEELAGLKAARKNSHGDVGPSSEEKELS